MRSLRPWRVRAPWRSRVRRSLQVQKIDLDALADRREVRAVAGFVLAARADDRGVELGDGCGELAAGVALVADHDQRRRCAGSGASRARGRPRARRVFGRGRARARVGCRPGRTGRAGGSPRRSGCGWRSSRSRRRRRAGCARTVSTAAARTRPGSSRPAPGRRRSRGSGWRTRRSAHSIVVGQPLRGACSSPGCAGSAGTGAQSRLAATARKRAVRRDAHDRLGDAERDDLRVGHASPGVLRPSRAGDRRRCRTRQSAAGRGRRASWPPWVDGAHRAPPTSTLLRYVPSHPATHAQAVELLI